MTIKNTVGPPRAQTCRNTFSVLALVFSLGCASSKIDAPSLEYPQSHFIGQLGNLIEREMTDKGLPALSIALVDGDNIVWAHGFGSADPEASTPATPETVYRMGSVSKLLTDIALMQLVEQEIVDLDADVSNYLPDFKPENPFDKPITLRQLISHRSGLVREPPVGNYFDPSQPDLATTVASLNGIPLVYPPDTKTKYSNAGVAVVGYLLERTRGVPFAEYMKDTILKPMGLTASSFDLEPEIERRLAKASMWTYDGRTFPAPVFQLGTGPAGNLYSTVLDLAKFLQFLFSGGRGPGGQILRPETIERMFTPTPTGHSYGIGFRVGSFDGHRSVGHGGAVYGFSTVLSALPDEKLGVVVVASLDVAHAAVQKITDFALRGLLAARDEKTIADPLFAEPISAGDARQLAGRYERANQSFSLVRRGRRLLFDDHRELLFELKASGDRLIADDRLGGGIAIERSSREGELILGGNAFRRVPEVELVAVPPHWRGLFGEYGWKHNVLYIFEKDNRLHALIEWFFSYPLTEISENVFAFPDYGLYHGERLIFTRNDTGIATAVNAAQVEFARLPGGPGVGETFKIEPLLGASELRRRALSSSPPREAGDFRAPDLVDLVRLDPSVRYDIRYAGTNNFMGTPLYQESKAFMQRPAAEAVVRAHRALKAKGYGLLIHDAYRPWYVTKMFFDATPESMRGFVANPANGSRHNRGCAVDLTLYDLETGAPIEMVSGYDEFTDRAHPFYPGGTTASRRLRNLLREEMEAVGFTVYDLEWWHFDFKDWRKYPILNVTFELIEDSRQ